MQRDFESEHVSIDSGCWGTLAWDKHITLAVEGFGPRKNVTLVTEGFCLVS